MNHKLLIAGLLTAVLIPSATIQAQRGGGSDMGSAATSGARDPSSMTGASGAANFNQMLNQQKGSIHFMGKVAVEEGSLPWDPIPVVVKCEGKTFYNAVADTKGTFDIVPPTRESEVIANRADAKTPAPASFVGCKGLARRAA